MKIALIGYGKMGKLVGKIATEAGHQIVATIDKPNDWQINEAALRQADVAIEFSTPDAVVENIYECFRRNIPVVTGTTGWEHHKADVRAYCVQNHQTLFAASNFSLGVNVFFRLSRQLAAMMNELPGYEVRIDETHHIHKLDKPSGTARVLADDLVDKLHHKTGWSSDKNTDNETIAVISHRIGEVNGEHIVTYTSPEDIIEIKHTALSRRGFALGALRAAQWVMGKKGFFTMDDMTGAAH
ncbi:MAG: 4-hydroxy-tetrahydrodipicolinate reductase [Bacteroidales bacterium]|jgi:4-hydroxy-tetrahydrodipicolinate reductase|nr:4-hydroxy-tetrahydrodipicolinate reductase [Bacteroidales bacterium]NCU34662.1 4-hydroxy-tetrahydrodipicolinate reductase [Candidatus Falkowbacteria bacterium]MDD2631842.1 4-hydroxy-tetrahydrodipicolinate reductase [Bacteroidales bacterium]MDD3132220.1 4-hydroxy-tetrahydrodipicolinate reductase [Bacteroidales bacterium]MDD3525782.1 4-hydroxy-tetrahydrodipicolinate reductase [Bacteroidales bacterium]